MKYTTLKQLKAWRRYLHENPELSQKEYNTSKYIRQQLEDMGLKYETPMETATIVTFDVGSDESIVLRADIDALPIKETNECDFASKTDGVMHACGHDGHTAMLLAAVNEISHMKENGELKINVIAVFQPSEESFGGANLLVGAYDFKKHNVKACFALHVNPDFPEGNIVIKPGPVMASCNEFAVEFTGKSAHVGKREEGINALNACVQVYQQFQMIPTYNLDSKHTNIIHVGQMNVGEVMNAVPTHGFMEGTIRTYDMDDLEITKNRMREIVKGVEISSGCKINLILREGYPATINDSELIDLAKSAVDRSSANLIELEEPYLFGEDFSFFRQVSPINYSFVGIRNEDLGYTSGLHTPTLQLREEALVYGVDYLVECVKAFDKAGY